jgi:AcrR family transcriptional regulator
MTPSRKERKETITRTRKEQLIKAAFSVFSEKGFASATTAEIAKNAGVAEGTIYLYFKSKRELFIDVVQNMIITMSLVDLIQKMPGNDIGAIFKGILQNRLNLIIGGSVDKMPLMMMEIQRDPELKALWAEQVIGPFMSRMDTMYSSMLASGKFRNVEPEVITRAIGGLILGFVMLSMMEGESNPLKRMPQDKVVDSLVDIILHGILKE